MWMCVTVISCRKIILTVSLVSMSGVLAGSGDPQAARIDVGGFKLNSLLLEPGGNADLPPIVFIHGASTSIYDPLLSFREKLEGSMIALCRSARPWRL